MASGEFFLPTSTFAYRAKPRDRLSKKPTRSGKKTITKVYKKVVKTIEEHSDADHGKTVAANKRVKKRGSGKTPRDGKVDVNGLNRRGRHMSAQNGTEEDSGDEFARQIEAYFLEDLSDERMDDVVHVSKTEEDVINEAWAAFDAAIAQDPSAVPKPKPKVVEDKFRMPVSRKRKRDIAENLAGLSTSRAKFSINLDMSFDVSDAPKYLQSQNLHYHVAGQDATTIKHLFGTLWLENHEWLIHEGYSLERVQRVKRLEITLLIKEGTSVKNTHCWSIKGDFNGKEQREGWKNFLEAARRWGRGEALDQLRMMEQQEKTKRLICVKDHLGNLYDHTGNYVRQKKRLVHAQVDAEIVLHFD